ncbi:MAG: hypothetical protein CM1200mP13_02590 [Candidatus Pelagibacterales bacterium]|nr:MAG: hypothetical protein CM1200mP13_02590 [Pelagibacterales bacterium]
MAPKPFAFIGGSKKIEKSLFEILLFCVLLVAGIFLLIESKSFNKEQIKINKIPRLISISFGSIIGFMSGIVGIGGGIFLSPLLFLMKAGYPKGYHQQASLFILINSIFGKSWTADKRSGFRSSYYLLAIIFIGTYWRTNW